MPTTLRKAEKKRYFAPHSYQVACHDVLSLCAHCALTRLLFCMRLYDTGRNKLGATWMTSAEMRTDLDGLQ